MNGRLRSLSGFVAAALLAACGRDDGRQPDPIPVLPTYSALVSTGFPITTGDVQVGSAGTFQRDRRLGANGGQFSVPLVGLTPPYVISGRAGGTDIDPIEVVAVTRASSGTINVTPLTRLIVLELIRQEPSAYFDRLLTQGSIPLAARIADFSPFTDEATVRAQATVVRLLRQELGIVVPASVATGDWVTTPFVNTPGDPMYDTLTAFSAKLAENNFNRYPNDRLAQLARCAREQISIAVTTAGGGDFYEFCPATRDAFPDEADASVLVFRLFDIRGNALSLRLRDSTVIGIELRRTGLPLYSCAEAACSLVMVGGQVTDRSRPLSFSNTVLTAADGSSAQLLGTAIGGVPGRPAINCERQGPPLFVAYPDGNTTAQCARASVEFEAVASSRYVYRSSLESFPVPEIRVDGNRLLSITLFQQDEDNLAEIPLFECVESACDGAVLSDLTAVGTAGARRTLTLTSTVLPSLSGGLPVTLDGAVELSNSIARIPPDCSDFPVSETLRVRVEGETDNWDVCPPYDVDDGLVGGFVVRDFNIGLNPGAQLGDYSYFFVNDQRGSDSELRIVASPSGVVRRLEYNRGRGESFACTDAACLSAVTIGPANAQSAHVVSIAPVTVPEVLLGDRPGDRRVSLQGQLLTAPDRSFND